MRGWTVVAGLGVLVVATLVAAWVLRRPAAASATPFLGHVAELRRRLVVMVMVLLGAVVAAMTLRIEATRPWVAFDPFDNLAAQVLRAMVADLVPADVRLVVLAPTDAFSAQATIALGLAAVVTMPVILTQLGLFFRPALKPRERTALAALLAPAMGLFVLGVAFCYIVVLAPALLALYNYAEALGAASLLGVGDFVSFVTGLCLVMGLAFQLPLIMYGAGRLGLAGPGSFLRAWRHAVVAIVVVAAIATPDPTVVSQVMVAAPLIALYFLGIALAAAGRRAFER